MSERPDGLHVLLLSEDSGSQSDDVVLRLFRRAVQQLGEFRQMEVDTNRIRGLPVWSEIRLAVRANAFRSTKNSQRNTLLLKRIATELTEGRLVVLHVDGDRPWSSRAESLAAESFRDVVAAKVLLILRQVNHDPDIRINRLIAMVPFYSIESWLLQATTRARELCAARGDCRETLRLLDTWEADRGLLDEIVKPKEATCLADRHNSELAQGLLRREVDAMRASGKSFAAFVDALDKVADIDGDLRQLERTWSSPPV